MAKAKATDIVEVEVDDGTHKLIAHPVGSRVTVELFEADDETEGGIVLPDTAKERGNRGRVLAVDPEWTPERPRRRINVDDVVVWGHYVGTEISLGGKMLFIIDQADILAVVTSA